jgi:arylsulfatase
LIRGNSQLPFAGMGHLTESSLLNVKNKSHSVTAQCTVPPGGANGVLVAQGGAFGGGRCTCARADPRTVTTCSG